MSAHLLADIRAARADELGADRLRTVEDALARVPEGTDLTRRVDLPGWLDS